MKDWADELARIVDEECIDPIPGEGRIQVLNKRAVAGMLRALRDDIIEEVTPKWQPIETAPKDGDYVILCGRHTTVVIAFYCTESERWIADGHPDCEEEVISPEFWMPMPESHPSTRGVSVS